MGNKQALLAAAKWCLYEKGFARTTSRDITAVAGVSLAAIGYHYGTKEALLTTAVLEALGDWGDGLAVALAAASAAATPADRFEAAWREIVASFERTRPLWRIQFEMIGSVDRYPQVREAFATANSTGRAALVALVGPHPDAEGNAPLSADDVAVLGTFYQVALAGMASQWLVDPVSALDGRSLLVAAGLLADHIPAPAGNQADQP